MPEYRDETKSLGELQVPTDLNVAREVKKQQKLSPGDIIYALEMAIACAISYWIVTYSLAPFVDRASDFLGGMWAAVATVFVFRDTRAGSVSAGFFRLLANCVSFSFFLLFLFFFSFFPLCFGAVLLVGTVCTVLF